MEIRFRFDTKFETQPKSRTNWRNISVTYGFNQQFVIYYNDKLLIRERTDAEATEKTYFAPMGKHNSIFEEAIYEREL